MATETTTQNNKIALPANKTIHILEAADIIRCEAKSSYTIIFFNDSKKIIASQNLKHIESLLSLENFLRIHKSHLINLDYVKEYNTGENNGFVTLSNGEKIEVAVRKKSYTSSVIKKYFNGSKEKLPVVK
ncbi:MAG: LytTR family transcriptional regulator [Bacteroidia bacterium]|nr:LytTR family transcriptional regulator [Bacteroidia bacterium]